MIGAVKDDPPLTTDVSLVDVTTESSVVGKDPAAGVPFSSTPLADRAEVDATTEESSVGKGALLTSGACEAAAAVVGSEFSGAGEVAACLSFICC